VVVVVVSDERERGSAAVDLEVTTVVVRCLQSTGLVAEGEHPVEVSREVPLEEAAAEVSRGVLQEAVALEVNVVVVAMVIKLQPTTPRNRNCGKK